MPSLPTSHTTPGGQQIATSPGQMLQSGFVELRPRSRSVVFKKGDVLLELESGEYGEDKRSEAGMVDGKHWFGAIITIVP